MWRSCSVSCNYKARQFFVFWSTPPNSFLKLDLKTNSAVVADWRECQSEPHVSKMACYPMFSVPQKVCHFRFYFSDLPPPFSSIKFSGWNYPGKKLLIVQLSKQIINFMTVTRISSTHLQMLERSWREVWFWPFIKEQTLLIWVGWPFSMGKLCQLKIITLPALLWTTLWIFRTVSASGIKISSETILQKNRNRYHSLNLEVGWSVCKELCKVSSRKPENWCGCGLLLEWIPHLPIRHMCLLPLSFFYISSAFCGSEKADWFAWPSFEARALLDSIVHFFENTLNILWRRSKMIKGVWNQGTRSFSVRRLFYPR